MKFSQLYTNSELNVIEADLGTKTQFEKITNTEQNTLLGKIKVQFRAKKN